jgi:nucleoside-diphosphate-sugar epimerase
LNKKPVAIIGSGFLASNLILGLEQKGYPIHVFSRSRPKVEIQNTTKFHAIDVTKDTISNEDFVLCNKIFFMLSIGVPGHQNVTENFELEYSVLKSLVNKAKSLSIKDFYFISSAAVYGDQYNKLVTEDEELNPQSEYAKCKIKMEEYLIAQRSVDFNPVIFRVSNPYGPFQYSQGIIKKLLDSSLNKESIIIDNLGESVRDYIYVGDCICLIIKLMESTNRFSIYNISTGIGTNTNELITIFNNDGLTTPFEYALEGNTSKHSISILDNSRIINEVSECTLTNIHVGIKKMIKQNIKEFN